MSAAATPQFRFDSYSVRPLTEQDRPYLDSLIEQDQYHAGRMDADFFLKREMGEDAWALEDEHGQIVFYFKTTTAVRLAIQFRPSTKPGDRLRNAAAMMRGLRWIEGVLKSNGFREIVTDTEGPELRNFLKRRLGFAEASLLTRSLSNMKPEPNSPLQALGRLPTDRQGSGEEPNVRT